MRLTVYLLLVFLCLICKAQNKLFLCNDYNNNGTYSGIYKNWTLQKGGNYLYIFYESSLPVNDSLFIRIDKSFNRKDSNYYEYDHYYLVPGASKKWAANKYTFTKTGHYKITVYDRNDNPLAAPYITDIFLSDSAYTDMYFIDTWYYNQSEIYFFEKVTNDTLYGRRNVFAFDSAGNKVIVYIGQENKQPFKSNHLFLSVYTADSCHEHISSYTYYVQDKWYWTHLPLYIRQKGKFSIEIYNDDDVFINSALLEIK